TEFQFVKPSGSSQMIIDHEGITTGFSNLEDNNPEKDANTVVEDVNYYYDQGSQDDYDDYMDFGSINYSPEDEFIPQQQSDIQHDGTTVEQPSIFTMASSSSHTGLSHSSAEPPSTFATQIVDPAEIRDVPYIEEDHVAASIDIYASAVKYGASRQLFDEIVNRVNKYIDGRLPPLLSYFRSRNALRSSYPVQPKEFHVCQRGCMLHKDDDTSKFCNHCKEPKYREDGVTPVATMKYLPLKEQLTLFLNESNTRDLLHYLSTRQTLSNDLMTDIFDGGVYKDLKETRFKKDLDLSISLFTDDFQTFKRGTHSMTLVHVVIHNLPPNIRMKDCYMLQPCIAPGPKKPADISTFLEPILEELNDLYRNGITVNIDGDDINIKVHLLFIGGDIPAVAKLAGHAGHQHYHGCRFCTIRGVFIKNRMIFPPNDMTLKELKNLIKNNRSKMSMEENVVQEDEDTEDESYDQDQDDTSDVEGMESDDLEQVRPKSTIRLSTMYQTENKDLGQKKACLFSHLPTFHGATFFPVDPMHLLGPGIRKQLWRIMCGEYGKEGNPLYLTKSQRELIGSRIAGSRSLIPSSFSGDCGDISFQSGFYRAVDWIHFVLYLVPTTILEFYNANDTKQALVNLATIYRYTLSREICSDDIQKLQTAVKSWINWLKRQVRQSNILPTVFTVNVHYLTHLHKIIERIGPLPYIAAFSMERTIGNIKRRIHSKRYAGVNAGNVLIELAAVRTRERLDGLRNTVNVDNENEGNIDNENENISEDYDAKKLNVIALSNAEDSPEIWGPFFKDSVRNLRCGAPLKHYWAWQHGSYMGIDIQQNELLEAGNRLFKEDVTYGGSTRESFVRLHIMVSVDKLRGVMMRKKPEKREYFGSLKFFFVHKHDDYDKRMLALVEIFKVVKGDGPWPYKTESGKSRHVVIDIDDIIEFAGRTKGSDTREYIYWSQQHTNSKKELPIDYNLDLLR
ncbi:hypothetical protein INT45_010943, partial [Circinella minor]